MTKETALKLLTNIRDEHVGIVKGMAERLIADIEGKGMDAVKEFIVLMFSHEVE